jgi:hypothetical protein
MRRLRWIGLLVAVLAGCWFVMWPQVQKRILRDRCAMDGGTLDKSGTLCRL